MASSEVWSLRSALMDVMDDLVDSDLETFKFYIGDPDLFRDFSVIRRHKLETTVRPKLLTAILDHYGVFTIDIVKTVLEKMNENTLRMELSNRCTYKPQEVLLRCQKKMASALSECFAFLLEGDGGSIEFDKGYTRLFIIVGGSGQVDEEHEVIKMERDSRSSDQETTILCQDLFEDQSGKRIRVVLTKGVAGVGKTVLTQKFSRDWAERKTEAEQKIQMLFHLTFRELNELKGKNYNLVEFIHECFNETKELFSFQQLQLLFILDGLDECKLTLDFSQTRDLTDPTENASVEELLVNLIRGDLCPSAKVWITTRPAAAKQIPEKHISMVTEVRGFTDQQKDEFFRTRIPDKEQATTIIQYIKKVRSLNSMCHIPVFCSILSNILIHRINTIVTAVLPVNLTQIYINHLVTQAEVQKQRCEDPQASGDPLISEVIWSLGKLAFEQLMEGNLEFSETVLSKCGLDAEDIARYSVFKEVLKMQPGRRKSQKVKVYCFIHLSMQEFLAALHVHQAFFISGVNLLSSKASSKSPESTIYKYAKSFSQMLNFKDTPERFYRFAVDLALKSPNGHLDLFIRFLLGLSLLSNQELLSGLIPLTGNGQTNGKIAEYIRKRLNDEVVSSEGKLNLLHCLNELHDHSLLEETENVLKSELFSNTRMIPANWAALSFILLSSDSDLKKFDLWKYQASEEALLGLLPVLKISKKVIIRDCALTEKICASMKSIVVSSSNLKYLDLTNNDLRDSGVELLCEGLKRAPCRLETLRLSGCLVSEKGGASLAAALTPTPSNRSSAHSVLTELDLSYNHLGSSAVLLKKLQETQKQLQMLRLDPDGKKFLVPGLKKYDCNILLDPNTANTYLRLSEDHRSATHVKESQSYPDHPDRFKGVLQVLGSSGLKGRCYWEVDWKMGERAGVSIGVSYRRVARSGEGLKSIFGHNEHSWRLDMTLLLDYYACHNGRDIRLKHTGRFGGGRVGVLLDWERGTLSFYDIKSKVLRTHLYTFKTTFTEELLPGFTLFGTGSSVSVVELNHD